MTPGDVNGDGKIDRDDFALIDRGYARYAGGAIAVGDAQWEDGDFNGDHAVDSADYFMMDTAFAKSGGGLSPDLLAERQGQFGDAYVGELVAAVPEPGVGALALVGLAALAGRHRGRPATDWRDIDETPLPQVRGSGEMVSGPSEPLGLFPRAFCFGTGRRTRGWGKSGFQI
jgi:hypothetical protein